MPVRRAPAALTGLLAAALTSAALSGCSPDSAATAPPVEAMSTTTAATPSESPSGPPPMPDEARGTSRKAAVAFVRHWVDTLNYSADTLDSAPLRELSSAQCDACTKMTRLMQRLERKGGRVTGQQWTIGEIEALKGASTIVQVQALVTFAASELIAEEGREAKPYPEGRSVLTFNLERTARGWTLRQVAGIAG